MQCAEAARRYSLEVYAELQKKKRETCSAKFCAARNGDAVKQASVALHEAALTLKDAELKAAESANLLVNAESAENIVEIEYKKAQTVSAEAKRASMLCRFEMGAPRVTRLLGIDGEIPSAAQLADIESLAEIEGLWSLEDEKQHYIDVMLEELKYNLVYGDIYESVGRVWGMYIEKKAESVVTGDIEDDPDMTQDERSWFDQEAQVYEEEDMSQKSIPQRCPSGSSATAEERGLIYNIEEGGCSKSTPQRCPSESLAFAQSPVGEDDSKMVVEVQGKKEGKRAREDADVDPGGKGKMKLIESSEGGEIYAFPTDVLAVQKDSDVLSLFAPVDKGECRYCKKTITSDDGYCSFEKSSGICHPVCDLYFRELQLEKTISLIGADSDNPVLNALRSAVSVAQKNVALEEKEDLANLRDFMEL